MITVRYTSRKHAYIILTSKTGVYRDIHYFSNFYIIFSYLSRNMKKISEFLSENFKFFVVKFSIYLNRCVFIMDFNRMLTGVPLLRSKTTRNKQEKQTRHMGLALRKRVSGHRRTVKAQISLRTCAVWSGPSLSANRIIGYYKMYEWRANDLRMPGMNMNLCILRIRKDTFSLGTAHIILNMTTGTLSNELSS